MTGPTHLADRLADDLARLDRELAELSLLASQAASEGARHEGRRSAAADKLAAVQSSIATDPTEAFEASAELLALTRRASLMEAQIEVLEGKRKVLQRFRDALASYLDDLPQSEGIETGSGVSDRAGEAASSVAPDLASDAAPDTAEPEPTEAPAVSPIVLAAQEELRREIARAMHDGPAQSMTNIVLQAQIAQRLIDRDPPSARAELAELIVMVQKTLDATQSFIFDVRPMVLDDLGLVPTLRRAARDRGHRAGKPVEFESLGSDRRLSTELESGLFRIIDDALAAYLAAGAERVALSLDWSNPIGVRMVAWPAKGAKATVATPASSRPDMAREDLPPLLAAMMAESAGPFGGPDSPPYAGLGELSVEAWREIEGRAATLGIIAELSSDRRELRMAIEVPADPPPRQFDDVGPSSY